MTKNTDHRSFKIDNTALILVDHQVGTIGWAGELANDAERDQLKMWVRVMARFAKSAGMPVVLTSSLEGEAQGPLLLAPALEMRRGESGSRRLLALQPTGRSRRRLGLRLRWRRKGPGANGWASAARDGCPGDIDIAALGQPARVLVGTAIKHAHPLVVGPSSVHTQRSSLQAGHQRIRAIGDQLRERQRIG